MKEEGDRSSERRRKHGRTASDAGSIIPEWASFPPELVQHVADCVLSTTGGVDAYMDMRAVCPSWRSAVAKPPPLAAFSDHRFRPRHWVMLDLRSEDADDDARLFLHTTTGRFRRLSLPVLRDHHFLGASDGLIVLMDREHPRLARVLNPLTGDMLHYAAPLWEVWEHTGSALEMHTAVSGSPRRTLVVWRDMDWRGHTVVYADPTSAEFTEEQGQQEPGTDLLVSMVTFQGNIYYADRHGWVFQFVATAERCDHEFVVIDIYVERNHSARSFLVESAGELLLVCHFDQSMKVFRVDVKKKLFEEVKSIGCRALFLGCERCLSVDADKLPSVDSDCIYMFKSVKTSNYRGSVMHMYVMHMYNLRDNRMEIIWDEPKPHANNHPRKSFLEDPWDYPSTFGTEADNLHPRPPSLSQVLLDYCDDNIDL